MNLQGYKKASKLQTINTIANNSFNYKVYKIKFKYDYRADNKVSSIVMQGKKKKVTCIPYLIFPPHIKTK